MVQLLQQLVFSSHPGFPPVPSSSGMQDCEGLADGLNVGGVDGLAVGLCVGSVDGLEVGLLEGALVGLVVGLLEGALEGDKQREREFKTVRNAT